MAPLTTSKQRPSRVIHLTEAGRALVSRQAGTVKVVWEGMPRCSCGAYSGSAHDHMRKRETQ